MLKAPYSREMLVRSLARKSRLGFGEPINKTVLMPDFIGYLDLWACRGEIKTRRSLVYILYTMFKNTFGSILQFTE